MQIVLGVVVSNWQVFLFGTTFVSVQGVSGTGTPPRVEVKAAETNRKIKNN